MTYNIDKFKINWTETNKREIVTSVTGYSYQLDSWMDKYLKQYPLKAFNTKILTKLINDDKTITISVSRLRE
jgi:hypothetical protein